MWNLILFFITWITCWVINAPEDKPVWIPVTCAIVSYLFILNFVFEVFAVNVRLIRELAEIIEELIKKDDK